MDRARISVPATAQPGEVIELRAMVQHPMETGFRVDSIGRRIPRDIVTAFACLYNGEVVFEAAFFPAVAANPFLTFHTVATETGTLEFRWTHQDGENLSEFAEITVA
ncbi:MAG: thiosulfate oxidation carrier complex protein SoxZ [Pseudomonadota bacterium]